ncbi:MAG: GNAT family N-acetyltransferase [Acidobacteria bacterium]|nr:GNAT family N-acetyltransferase [Acidobacteriota bacterium]
MQIITLTPDNEQAIQQCAQLLYESFKHSAPEAWPTLEAALEEVRESLEEDRVSRIAIDHNSNVIGWVGGINQYNGHAWELHPLVVSETSRGQGLARLLVQDLEAIVKARGAVTLYLGTDDEDNRTSLSNVDLYPNVWEHVANIENHKNHPYAFYQKMGFVIVGVIPDANGPGKPDIFMAKRIA